MIPKLVNHFFLWFLFDEGNKTAENSTLNHGLHHIQYSLIGSSIKIFTPDVSHRILQKSYGIRPNPGLGFTYWIVDEPFTGFDLSENCFAT